MPGAWAGIAAAAISAAGAIGGSVISSDASKSSANTIANSANQANRLLEQQQQQTTGNLLPFLNSGTNALSALNAGLGLTPTAPTMTGGSGPSIIDLLSVGNGTNLAAFGPAGATNAPVYQVPWGAGTNPSPTSGSLVGYLTGGQVQGTGATPDGQNFTTLAQLSQQQQAQGGGPGSILQSPLLAPPTLAQFQADPGYQFQLSQGIDAIQNSAAAGAGGGMGGNLLKALQTFGTGLANDSYQTFLANFTGTQNRALNSLFNLTGAGQNAAVSQGGFGATAAGAVGNNLTGAGSALGAGQIGAANAQAGGVNNLAQILQLLAQNQNNPSSSGSGFMGTLGGFAPQFGNLTQGVDPGMTGTF